jgi:hypothetical protein
VGVTLSQPNVWNFINDHLLSVFWLDYPAKKRSRDISNTEKGDQIPERERSTESYISYSYTRKQTKGEGRPRKAIAAWQMISWRRMQNAASRVKADLERACGNSYVRIAQPHP